VRWRNSPEEPRVLHRDDRLRGEILQQCNLIAGKWPHLAAIDREVPQHSIVPKQRDDEHGSNAAEIGYRPGYCITVLVVLGLSEVVDLDNALAAQQTLLWPGRPVRPSSKELGQSRWRAADRCSAHQLALISPQRADIDLAQAGRLFKHCIEHWREVAGRRIDDLQYLGGRGLLRQRLARFGQ
jgi:hypothetical protein